MGGVSHILEAIIVADVVVVVTIITLQSLLAT